ncbi:MAG: Xaa-Pro dipeptidase [Acidobacteria bacterium]|nr:Xaa-Pro dipeptidase [Acidobacteriota bacterium]
MVQSFAAHIQTLQRQVEETLSLLEPEGIRIDAVLFHSGTEGVYFGDDKHIPFEAHAHYMRWVPVARPDQMVLVQPHKKPRYFQVVPTDFWYEQTFNVASWWADSFEVVPLSDPNQIMDLLPSNRRIAFMGENTAFASQMGLPSNLHNERHLRNRLDYHRSVKTPFEVEQIRIANQHALKGHEAAHQAFMAGKSEWGIHMDYLLAAGMTEFDTPYTNIVAVNEKSAILHYQNKRMTNPGQNHLLLIDAGHRANGYCSDITRTYTQDSVHPVMTALCEGVNKLQLHLVDQVRPGISYIELHEQAHAGILDLLLEHDVVRGSRSQLEEDKVSSLFYPHGTGHLLGLQVHDVSGHFKDETGILAPPPEDHKFLRLTRQMEPGMVFTVEPGLYFIPVLLDPKRNDTNTFNWSLIDQLIPFGGIRIEDNILVTEQGQTNLTR